MKKIFRSRIFHNFSWLFIDRFIRLAISLYVSIVVARYLGPEGYGIWNYLLSITMFFVAFVSLGFASIVPREIVKNPDKSNAIVSLAFLMKIIAGALGFVLSILIFILFKNPDTDMLLMMSLMASLLIFQSGNVSDFYFKAKLQAKYSVIGRNIAFIIVALLKLYFVYNHFGLIFFVASNALEMLIGGFLYSPFILKREIEYLLNG